MHTDVLMFTLKPLILKQKQAMRTISNAGYRDHTAPLFANQQILPVNELIHYYKTKFMHNCMFGHLPPSFFETWQTNRERSVVRQLRNADDLYVPPHRIEFFKRMPLTVYLLLLPGIRLMIANSTQDKKSY